MRTLHPDTEPMSPSGYDSTSITEEGAEVAPRADSIPVKATNAKKESGMKDRRQGMDDAGMAQKFSQG